MFPKVRTCQLSGDGKQFATDLQQQRGNNNIFFEHFEGR
jgi:hypothetical protein